MWVNPDLTKITRDGVKIGPAFFAEPALLVISPVPIISPFW
jgi:hypothetical protein